MAHSLTRALRITAAIPGTLPGALGLGVLAARAAPLSLDARLVLAALLVAPIWVALMCWVLLARTAARAWATCGVLTAVGVVVATCLR